MAEKKKAADHVLKVAVCGMLLALEVLFRSGLLEIQTPIVKIGFAPFIAAITAYLYGPFAAAIVHMLGDVLDVILGGNGPPHPGIALTAGLMGLIYGLFCYRPKPVKFWRILLAVLVTQLVCTIGLNTLWMGMITSKGYLYWLYQRLMQSANLL